MEHSQENKYKDYVKESYNREYIENDNGFATYSFAENYCIIHNMYISPKSRSKHVGSEMADYIAKQAKEKDCNRLICEIDTRSNTYTGAITNITGYGFKVIGTQGFYVVLEKDL